MSCIANGKEHKKYEFGNKVTLAHTITGEIVVGVQNAFNEYDSNCLPLLLEQVTAVTGKKPARPYCDRGFRGKSDIDGTKIETLNVSGKNATTHNKRKAQAKFRRWSAVEAVISHVNYDFRTLRNFLKGTTGDTINLLLAAAAFNFKKWMWATAGHFLCCFFIQIFILTAHPDPRSKALIAP